MDLKKKVHSKFKNCVQIIYSLKFESTYTLWCVQPDNPFFDLQPYIE